MSLAKLKILLWKNWILLKRRPFMAIFQIVFPILVILVASWLKSTFEYTFNQGIRGFEGEFQLSNFSVCITKLERILYAPDNSAYQGLIKKSFENFGFQIKGFYNSSLMRNEFSAARDPVAMIELMSDSEVTQDLPKELKYSFLVKNYDIFCNLMVQNELEKTFLELSTKSQMPTQTTMSSFPYDDQGAQMFAVIMIAILPTFLVLSMFSMVSIVVKDIVAERENRLKEFMKMMGLSSSIYWLSWFIQFMTLSIFIYTLVTIFLCFPIVGGTAIFHYTNFFIIWLFFILFCFGVVTFCFMVSTFFKSASSASYISSMLFFTTFIPYYIYSTEFVDLNIAVKWLFLLPINTAFGQGILMTLNMELNKIGINFSNLFNHYEGFNFSLGEVMIAMILSSMIHILIALYIDSIFPGNVGVPKPWYFPMKSLINMMRKTEINLPIEVSNVDKSFTSDDDSEEEPKHLNAKVRIVNLTKKFGSFTAVNNLSLNIYEDQITVLLGHNGGGKTTAMNVLTGMLPPTTGTAYINDYDIKTETEEARKSLGICPQHDILFDNMTVSDHITFFCKLKGMSDTKEINDEVNKYLLAMDLMDKKDKRSKTLSGGQKRKLSIANALCANSKFVVLDEPTSGLDVNARRRLWDLLIAEKKFRTILLTTHYMDEAEVLGDRIAIMSDGRLKTVGTSFFLKKKFGSGYRLIIVKSPNCDVQKILKYLQIYSPHSTIESDEQMEVIYVLSDEYIDKFEEIFKYLEENSLQLGIQSLGCSLATLEDVFLTFGDENNNDTAIKFNDNISFTKVSNATLIINQIYAMILKKFHYTRRNYIPLIIWTILSAWFLVIFLAVPMDVANDFDVQLNGLVNTNEPDASINKFYKNLFTKGAVEFTNRDIRDFIYGNFLERNHKYIIGVNFDKNIVWHNAISFQGSFMAEALNFYHRAILKDKAGSDFDIFPTYSKFSSPEESTNHSRNQFDDISVYMLIFLVLTFWSSIHISLKIKERVLRMKLLQFISGVNRFLFTFTSLMFDSLMTIIILFIVVGIVTATGRDGFNTFDEIAVYLVAIPFYVINVIPFIYVMSFWFKKHTTGETVAALFPFLFIILHIIYSILDQKKSPVAPLFYWIGMLFGPFSLFNIFNKLQAILLFDEGEIWSFGNRGIGINLIMMSAGFAIFLLIVLFKDFLIFRAIRYKSSLKKTNNAQISTADDDVLAEIERVRAKSTSQIIDSNLTLQSLSKSYGKFKAVNQLYVAVEPAECFGLLGVNGAGKTSVFKMLTGDEIITSGNAWIRGYSLITEISKVYNEIGYCPQYDALLGELTGRETIQIFCLLRGVPREKINEITDAFACELDFRKYLDVKVDAYSGGNKRKLSTCLSLIGDTSLVFLDECSSGIDARAKRQLWNAIKKARSSGRSIVLSSHSMQECESLCTRLAIMVDGEFQCIGSIQHIKNKFAKGFILKIMMSRRDDENLFNVICSRIATAFPMAELKERFMGLLTFHINLPELRWSDVFAVLSKIKLELDINDYTLTQSSLESVFLFFSQKGNKKRKIE